MAIGLGYDVIYIFTPAQLGRTALSSAPLFKPLPKPHVRLRKPSILCQVIILQKPTPPCLL